MTRFIRCHINLATEAVQECELNQLIFLPNYISPFKGQQCDTGRDAGGNDSANSSFKFGIFHFGIRIGATRTFLFL